MTRLARISLRYRTVTLLVVAMLIAAGIYSVGQLNRELFPSLEIPNLVVTAALPGAGPNEVAEDLAVPIEGAFLSTSNLEHVQSTNLEGVAIVSASYEFGTDMDEVHTEIREAVAGLNLPAGAETQVQRISLDAFPVYSIAVSGADPAALEDFVTASLAPAIDRLSEVAEIRVAGGSNEAVAVTLDPAAMSQAGVTTAGVMTVLGSAQVSVPVGSVSANGFQLPARVVAALDGVEGVENLLVPGMVPGTPPVPLSQIANVSLVENGSGSTVSRLDGQPAMSVEIIKAQGENTVDTVAAVSDAIEAVAVPDGITVTEVINQAPEIQSSISEMTRDAVIGGILAVLMILVFLRSFRGTLVSGISIPLSLLVAFILMNLEGITLNILTLGALSVAIGRVIDDAIVVLENIHRLLDEGYERSEAVLKGTTQMVPAITASTITTVAVFLPLAFIGGLVGQVFVGFALTVTFALLASLIVAVTVVPVLAITLLKRSHRKEGQGEEELGVDDTALRRIYRKPLAWALEHRWTVVIVAFVLLIASMASLAAVPVTLFPSEEATSLSVSLTGAPGTSLDSMSEQVALVESELLELDGVERVATVVGTSTDNPLAALIGGGGGGANSASITIDLGDEADIETLTTDIETLIPASGLSGTVAEVGDMSDFGGSNLNINVTGSDFEDVEAGSAAVQEALVDIDGIEGIESNLLGERPEIVIEVDNAAAAGAGLNAATLAGAVRAYLTPIPATNIVIDDATVSVIVGTDPAAIATPEALATLPLGPGVALGDVAEVSQGSSPIAVTHFDGNRSAEVSATITDPNFGAVNVEVQTMLDGLELPAGVEASLGGAAEQQQESFAGILTAMVIAVALVYLSMVVTFGSLLTPFVILLTLPLAAIGAFPALAVTGRELGLPSMLGLLMLIGIVVTNAIVMLEFVERLKREDGLNTMEALKQGAETRLRPILMTAIVTILALTPLALGLSDGALLSASLATVVIGGLFSSTLLTLFVIPAVYSLFDGLKRRFPRGDDGIDPVEPGRPAETIAASTP
ncbi:MAG TPA: efflux RND transporter permease subunit [Acidimicrobiia bacterium]|nr:efflux RND transporter permease subunit [Acidimicrobiia bacterium]